MTIPSLTTAGDDKYPGAPAALIAVLYDDWTPKAESNFAQQLMQLLHMEPDLHVTTSPPADGEDASARVLRLACTLGAKTYSGKYDPVRTPHLIFFCQDEKRPTSSAPATLTRNTFVGERKKVRRMRDTQGRDYPELPEKVRYAPPSQSPNHMMSPPRHSGAILPFWAYL